MRPHLAVDLDGHRYCRTVGVYAHKGITAVSITKKSGRRPVSGHIPESIVPQKVPAPSTEKYIGRAGGSPIAHHEKLSLYQTGCRPAHRNLIGRIYGSTDTSNFGLLYDRRLSKFQLARWAEQLGPDLMAQRRAETLLSAGATTPKETKRRFGTNQVGRPRGE